MRRAVLIIVILIVLFFLADKLRNKSEEPGPGEKEVPAESSTDDSAADSTSESTPRFVDAETVREKFLVYKQSFEELDRRVVLANQGPYLREHLTNMSQPEQAEFAKQLVRCSSYFRTRSRMEDGFDDPDFDMRLNILSMNLNDTAFSSASVASGYSGAGPLELLNTEKEAYRIEVREILAARDTANLQQFRSEHEHRCLRLFDWMDGKS